MSLYTMCIPSVFLYGRGARERSEFYWLKASYFTLKFHPVILSLLSLFMTDLLLKNYYLAGPERLELPTSSFEDLHSIQLS